jgi:hypothetical protein
MHRADTAFSAFTNRFPANVGLTSVSSALYVSAVGVAQSTALSQPRIRVVVGDAHPEDRRALRSRVGAASDVEIIGEAADGLPALELLRLLRPHVALLDANLPSLGGNAVARVLANERSDVHSVVLTDAEVAA